MGVVSVYENIYQIEIPLPGNPLRATNAYFIRGDGRNLLIDNGFHRDECRIPMEEALRSLGVKMEETDLFITHKHSDHAGLTGHLASPTSNIYMSALDGEAVKNGQDDAAWEQLNRFCRFSALTSVDLDINMTKHPGYQYASGSISSYTEVVDGTVLPVGKYRFRCIHTSGHTAGHMCLYEPDEKILFSGDHILGRITPNITLVDLENDVLADYLQSLDKLAGLDVKLVLPGHRMLVEDCAGRIEELKQHHQARLQEVLEIVGGGCYHTTDVASRMKWSLTYKSWEEYPPAQKLFATGEALAHLFHLVKQGRLQLSDRDGIAYFSRA